MWITRYSPGLLVLTGWCLMAVIGHAQDASSPPWNQFRGPHGNGHSTAVNVPVDLSEESNLAWRTSLPGRGWSSPLILGDEIWLTTALETEADPEPREPPPESASGQGLSAFSVIQLQAICLDRKTGDILRAVDLFSVEDPPLIHSMNSFASPTPVADEQFVYCHFGTFGTAAVDRQSGEVVWRDTTHTIDHETGPGSSPILHDGLLIVHCDGTDEQYVCALDARDGREVWKTERSGEMSPVGMYKKAFSTPIVIRRGDHQELVSAAANWVYAYDPATGRELWRVSYGQLGFSNVARPLMHDQLLLVCSCFMKSRMLAIDVSGSQPVNDDRIQWTYQGQVPNMPSPIVVEGMVYFASDRGIVTCVDATSGEKQWQQRLAGACSASPVLADGYLFLGDHEGVLHVLQPSPEGLQVIASNPLDGRIMASPAAVDESLFVRTDQSLYHFRKPADGPDR